MGDIDFSQFRDVTGSFLIQSLVDGEFHNQAQITVTISRSDPWNNGLNTGSYANPLYPYREYSVASDNPSFVSVKKLSDYLLKDVDNFYVIAALRVTVKGIPAGVRMSGKKYTKPCKHTRFNARSYSASNGGFDTYPAESKNVAPYTTKTFDLQINTCQLNIRDCETCVQNGDKDLRSVAMLQLNYANNYSPVYIRKNGVWKPYNQGSTDGYIYQYDKAEGKWKKVNKLYKRIGGKWVRQEFNGGK